MSGRFLNPAAQQLRHDAWIKDQRQEAGVGEDRSRHAVSPKPAAGERRATRSQSLPSFLLSFHARHASTHVLSN